MSLGESERSIKRLINFGRLSNYGSIVPLLVYLPIGLILGLIRCFIFLHICILFFLLPNTFPLKRWILRIMLTVIGLPIMTHGEPRLGDKKKIVIANHISNLDPFILTLLYPHVLAIESPSLYHLRNVPTKQIEVPADKDHSEMIKDVKEKLRECQEPLLFYPEKVKTNGIAGVLKFSLTPFEVDHPIQPVTIQAKRYLFHVNISTFSSSVVEDLLWSLILPFTLFNIKYLPLTEKKRDESSEQFASRVQTNVAKSLNLQALSESYTDISQYVKERERARVIPSKMDSMDNQVRVPKDNSDTIKSLENNEFQKMVLQVRDVLPDTPVSCIESELKKTSDVDITITNILEGKVDISSSMTAEASESSQVSLKSLSEGQSFKANKFYPNAHARQLSFAERKQAMLEAARLKYRIKHGL